MSASRRSPVRHARPDGAEDARRRWARCTATASPAASSRSPTAAWRSTRARSIRRCCGSSRRAGSRAAGAPARTTAAPASTPSPRPDGSSSPPRQDSGRAPSRWSAGCWSRSEQACGLRVWLCPHRRLFTARRSDARLDEEIAGPPGGPDRGSRGAAACTRHEARLAAQRDFGGVDRVREAHRALAGLPWLDAWRRDVVVAVRRVVSEPAFSAAVVAALAIGIGGAVSVVGAVTAISMAHAPVQGSGRGDGRRHHRRARPARRRVVARLPRLARPDAGVRTNGGLRRWLAGHRWRGARVANASSAATSPPTRSACWARPRR